MVSHFFSILLLLFGYHIEILLNGFIHEIMGDFDEMLLVLNSEAAIHRCS